MSVLFRESIQVDSTYGIQMMSQDDMPIKLQGVGHEQHYAEIHPDL